MNEVIVTQIESGDTLSEIAVWHGVSVDALQKWNRIENPDLVLVGQRIVVYKTDSYESSVFESAASHSEAGVDEFGGLGVSGFGSAIALAILLIWFWRNSEMSIGSLERQRPNTRAVVTLSAEVMRLDTARAHSSAKRMSPTATGYA